MKKMRSMKKTYIIYGLVLITYIMAAGAVEVILDEKAKTTYDALSPFVAHVFLVFGFGILLGLPGIFEQVRVIGYWSFEWTKFIVVFGIGMIATAIHFSRPFVPEGLVPQIAFLLDYFENEIVLTFGLFIMGWAIPSSIRKQRMH